MSVHEVNPPVSNALQDLVDWPEITAGLQVLNDGEGGAPFPRQAYLPIPPGHRNNTPFDAKRLERLSLGPSRLAGYYKERDVSFPGKVANYVQRTLCRTAFRRIENVKNA
jgi:hypothetical protein